MTQGRPEIPPIFLTAALLCDKATEDPTTHVWTIRNIVAGFTDYTAEADRMPERVVRVKPTLALVWTRGALPGPFRVTVRYVTPSGPPHTEKDLGVIEFKGKQRHGVWHTSVPLALDEMGLYRLEIRANGQLLTTVPFWLDLPEDAPPSPQTAH